MNTAGSDCEDTVDTRERVTPHVPKSRYLITFLGSPIPRFRLVLVAAK